MVGPAPATEAEEELQRLLFDPVAEWLLFEDMTTQQLSISGGEGDALPPPPPSPSPVVPISPPLPLAGAPSPPPLVAPLSPPLPLAGAPPPLAAPSEEEDDQGDSSSSDDQGDTASTSTSGTSSIPQGQAQGRSHSDDDKDDLDLDLQLDLDDEDESTGAGDNDATDLLPPVPPILVQLQPHHETLPIGHILSILGNRVIVEGSVEHNPLNEGSILWLTHTRTPLGLVDETFGPVKTPFYAIRYNSPDDLPPAISVGTPVSFVPEFATFVLSANKDVYQKGYDIADDEIADELQFSDDEKEADYKRSIRQAKRAAKNTKHKQPPPVKNRTNVKKDGNFPSPSQLPHPIVHSQQNQQGLFSQNQLPPNQLPPNQFEQNQFAQNQFPQANMPQYQLSQTQMLQNQLLLNLSMLATGMQIPSLGLAMNTNQSPFMAGGINFPPSAMQFTPGNMQLNPGIFPSGGARPPMQGTMQFNPANAGSSGKQPVAPMQFHPGNVATGGQGQFSPGHSFPFPLPFPGEGTNLQFSPGLLSNSNRGERPNQRGRGGRHLAGRNGNVRP